MIAFYLRAIRLAFTHSLERADLVGGAIAVLGGAIAYFRPGLADELGIGIWLVPLVFFLILFLVRLTLAPFWLYWEERTARIRAEDRVHQFESSRPHIVFVRYRTGPMFRPSVITPTKVPAGEMLQAWFENQPEVPDPSAVAVQVTALCTFFAAGSIVPLFQTHGQWAESTAPDHMGYKDTHSALDLPPGANYGKLLVAVKYPGENEAYAYSAESLRDHIDARNPALRLPPGDYLLSIDLRGTNLSSTIRLTLANPGAGSSLSLTLDEDANKPAA